LSIRFHNFFSICLGHWPIKLLAWLRLSGYITDQTQVVSTCKCHNIHQYIIHSLLCSVLIIRLFSCV